MAGIAQPTRVLHLIAPAPSGGAESVVRGLVRASRLRGIETMVAALLQTEGPSPLVSQLLADGARVVEVRCGRRRYGRETAEVARLAREWPASLIHTHVYHADLVGYRAAKRAGIPVVATVHGFTQGDWKNRFYQWLDRRLLARFDEVICVSETVRDRLAAAGCPLDLLHVVRNGFAQGPLSSRAEARAALEMRAGGPAIGWIGRLSHEKGADLLVEALRDARFDLSETVLIGDGPEREAVEGRIRALGLQRRVRLAGRRDEAASLLPAFDLLVLSSRTEGSPMVLLEAMAAGVPVVAYAVGGIPRMISDEAGWLVPPGDIAGLGDAIVQALGNPAEAARRGARARKILDGEFGLDPWIDRVAEVYASAASGIKPAR